MRLEPWPDTFVEKQARQLAESWGLPVDRVRAVLFRIRNSQARTEEAGNSSGPVPAGGAERKRPVAPTDVVRPALEKLGREDALALFEQADLGELARKVDLTWRLTYNMAPLHALKDLPGILDRLVDHLGRNRTSLLKFGFARRVFTESLWHDVRLTNLYFTKIPYRTSYSAENDWEAEFNWPKHPTNQAKVGRPAWGAATKIPVGLYWTHKGEQDASYPDRPPDELFKATPVFDGLGQENADRLVQLRPQVLEAKIRVLEAARDALKGRRNDTVWDRATDVLAAAFNAEEAGFLLDLDAKFLCFDIRSGEWIDQINSPMAAGGIAELLMVLGHYQKEVEFGTFDGAARAATAMPRRVTNLTYYDILKRGWGETWDPVLAGFGEALAAERPFWETWATTLAGTLGGKFRVPVLLDLGDAPAGLDPNAIARLEAVGRYCLEFSAKFGAMPSIQVEHAQVPMKTELSPADEQHARALGLNHRLRIVVTGRQMGNRGNEVMVNGRPIRLPDKALAGLLYLIAAWRGHGDGWVTKAEMEAEGLFTDEGFQGVERIRIPFREPLGMEGAKDLIEGDGSGRIRLSNPIQMVSAERSQLLGHNDPLVVRMTKRLKKQ